MRNLVLMVLLALSSCARNPTHPSVLLDQDESIVFPELLGPMPVVGRSDKPYALEGATLQALLIATNDLLPPVTKDSPCWDRRDAYVYQVLRRAEVIFVEIYGNPAACEGNFLMLDSGWRYAISLDGRILRRLQTGDSEWPVSAPARSDAGVDGGQGGLDVSGAVEVPLGNPPFMAPVPPSGAAVDGGAPGDGGANPGR